MRKITMLQAINEALHEEMERDGNVFVIGEDVGEYGGCWFATEGLYEKYGAMRAMDTPISEAGFVGLCVGAAMAGLRPVAEIMYFDFITACMDQLINQAAKADLMSGWQLKIPLVVRAQCGIGSREAGQHSQFLENWFLSAPGFKVLVPSNAHDAKGLLKSAIRDDSPVLFLEHRGLYYNKQEIPDQDAGCLVEIGKANLISEGDHLTLVSYGNGVRVCQEAMALMPHVGIDLIDLRSLLPMDMDMILRSVAKTGRLLVVHETAAGFSVGSEIVRRVVAEGFNLLDAEPLVYGGVRTVTPFASNLEDAIMLHPEEIVSKSRYLLTGVLEI